MTAAPAAPDAKAAPNLAWFYGDDAWGLDNAADAVFSRLEAEAPGLERTRVSGDSLSAARLGERVATVGLEEEPALVAQHLRGDQDRPLQACLQALHARDRNQRHSNSVARLRLCPGTIRDLTNGVRPQEPSERITPGDGECEGGTAVMIV